MDGRYYWLKLKRDFFKRHDIRIIEDLPNGKEYILFYLKLLCESVDHEGKLRFSESIPYSDTMLSTITNTNVDIVRSAIKAFTELDMMELLDDGTFYMREVEKMIGSGADNDNANRQRRFRESQKAKALEVRYDTVTKCNADVTECVTKDNESKSIEIEIDKEIDNKGFTRPADATPPKRFVKPSFDQVKDYCYERGNKVDPERFYAYYESCGWTVQGRSMKDWKAAIRYWETRDNKTYNRRGAFFAPTGNEDEYAKVNAGALQPIAPISEVDATEDDLRALGIGSALRGE